MLWQCGSELLLGASLAAVVGASSTAYAAASTAAPIQVKSCHVIAGGLVGRRGAAIQETIRISFLVPEGPAADVARFALVAPGEFLRDFTARGLFSQGVIIADRILAADPSAQTRFNSVGGGAKCVPTYVHFVDGTSWTANASSS